jgi:Na+:H+ antiporter, NhaC family
MDLLFALTLSFLLLLFSAFRGYFIAYPLLLSLVIFVIVLIRRGFSLKSLVMMGFLSSQKSFSVLSILLIIGAVTAIWMASGTVPAIVYYGIRLINPRYFILATFVLTSLVSLLIGTSFGTISTVGIALMLMANGSYVDSHIIAGAIIAGAYFGDRCSPMSSSANLVATVTKTRLYSNIQNMWISALIPLAVSIAIYAVLSLLNPVEVADQAFLTDMTKVFKINWVDLLPAVTILVLSIFQIEVKLSMLLSIMVAIIIALVYQHYALLELIKFMILGFKLDETTPLTSILLGGGILSMIKVSVVVVISTAFVGIFAGTQTLQRIESVLEKVKSRRDRFLSTCLVGIAAAAFGCTQTIAILLTQQLVEKNYQDNETGNEQLALDLENTVVVIAPLIPWNIAGLVPATILHTDPGFIPYAVYLYLIPLLNLIQIRLNPPPIGRREALTNKLLKRSV